MGGECWGEGGDVLVKTKWTVEPVRIKGNLSSPFLVDRKGCAILVYYIFAQMKGFSLVSLFLILTIASVSVSMFVFYCPYVFLESNNIYYSE